MTKNNLSKFSVIRTNFKVFEKDNVKYILKEINLTSLNSNMCDKVKEFLIQYITKIKESGIPIPEIKEHYIKNDKIYFVCRYRGENIFQLILSQEPSKLLSNKNILSQIFEIIKKSQKANIDIDPHPKNFVLQDGKVYYVDFSPPYLSEYNKMIIDNTKEEHKELVKNNLEAFSPASLGYHFAADLLKEDKKFEIIMPQLYSQLRNENIINTQFEEFIKKANEIKEIEIERVGKNVFLI